MTIRTTVSTLGTKDSITALSDWIIGLMGLAQLGRPTQDEQGRIRLAITLHRRHEGLPRFQELVRAVVDEYEVDELESVVLALTRVNASTMKVAEVSSRVSEFPSHEEKGAVA